MEALWRLVYAVAATERRFFERVEMALEVERVISDMAPDVVNGALDVGAAMAILDRALLRIQTRGLMLHFPLEDRMN